jgi:hypothetical protein
VRVDAADAQSGVRELRVLGAGQVRASDLIAAALGGCGEPGQGLAYTYAQPCADDRGVGGPRTIALDTSSWPSGEHADVRVEALDGGGETVSSQAFVVRIDRDQPTVTLNAPARVAPGGRIRATASGQDAHSGIDRVEIEISRNGKPFVSYDPDAPPVAAAGAVNAASSYRLRARAFDRVGLASAFASARVDVGRRAAARLRSVVARRRGGLLVVRGRLARSATGRVRIGLRARVGGRLRRARQSAPIRSGRFRARLRLGRALRRARRGVLTVGYGGDARHRRARVVKRLRLGR